MSYRITPESNPKVREAFEILDRDPEIGTADLARKVGIAQSTAAIWLGRYLEDYKLQNKACGRLGTVGVKK